MSLDFKLKHKLNDKDLKMIKLKNKTLEKVQTIKKIQFLNEDKDYF